MRALYFHCDMKALTKHRCVGKEGICSFTGEEHVQLSFDSGPGEGGAALTEDAQEYPAAFANLLSEGFCGAYFEG